MSIITKISQNLKSGITVSLVSISLSISLAIASGVNPFIGIITAMWAGLAASFFASSNYNIIGPTGALSGVLSIYALQFGIQSISILAIISGIFILIAYILTLERFLIFIPSSVIHGITLGIAFIIGLNQINAALSLNLPKHVSILKNLIETLNNFSNISAISLIIFMIFLISLVLLRKFIPKLPGVIILSPIGILIGYISKFIPLKLEILGSKFGEINIQLFEIPQIKFDTNYIVPALIIAFISILETMLSAKIADGMTGTKHKPNKEIFGLGIANIVCGLMGGIPATAALARTALNIKTGATDKISATISSLFIIIWSICFLYFTFMPMAIIAAILVYVSKYD